MTSMALHLHSLRGAVAAAALGSSTLALAATSPAPQNPALRASQPEAGAIASPVVVPLDAATLAALPREPVTQHMPKGPIHCEGVPLVALLRAGGAMPPGRLPPAHLSRYVVADARNGGRVLFSLAELDPETGGREVFVVDRCDGKPLPAEDGPLRLLVPGDARPARALRQLEALTVVVAP